MHAPCKQHIYWLYLLAAILFEVTGSAIMKLSSGSDWSTVGLVIMYILIGISYYFLAKAAVGIPIGVTYAFWESLGLVLITIVGLLFLGEHMTPKKMLGLLCVLLGTFLVHKGTENSAHSESTDEKEQCKSL